MFWIPLATAALGTYLGAKKYERQKQIEDQTRNMRAAEIRASPWTGRGPSTQIDYAGSQLGEMGGGALSGASMGMGAVGGWQGLLASKGADATPTQAPMGGTQPSAYDGNEWMKPSAFGRSYMKPM